MIGFISVYITQSLLVTFSYRQYGAIADLHNLELIVAQALGFSLSASRLLATDLNTETITLSLHYTLLVLHINQAF
jgi:hypothetical protein